jgi:hypothetical protein
VPGTARTGRNSSVLFPPFLGLTHCNTDNCYTELGDTTGSYSAFYSALSSTVSNSTLENVKVTFGPNGELFLLHGGGKYRWSGLNKTGIIAKIDANGSGVKHVTLGVGRSWVILFKDGTVEHNLNGNYGNLENLLDDGSDGDIKVCAPDATSRTGYRLNKCAVSLHQPI